MLNVYAVFLVLTAASTQADYTCMCNYNVELEVHSAKSESSTVIGSLYEFDCKEQVSNDQGWVAIAFEHKPGYVKFGPNIESQICPGDPPETDKIYPVTTVGATQTTTPVPTTTTTTEKTTTIPPTTTPVSTTITTRPTTTTPTTTTTTSTTTTPSPTTTPTTTTTTPVKTTTKATTTASVPVTTSKRPVTSHTLIQGNTSLCPAAVHQFTNRDGGYLAQYDQSCYEIVPHIHQWSYAERDCKSKGGHLVHISNQGEQNFISTLLQQHYNHKVWIGLTDQHHEGRYSWTSGDSVAYTNWINGHGHLSSLDCVSLDPKHGGYWNEEDCTELYFLGFPEILPYICQYDIDHTGGASSSFGDGNTHLCSSRVKQQSLMNGGVLGQYGQSCYELLPLEKLSWYHGEQRCQAAGGHLVHISNADEQNFMQSFMNRHMPHHAVWIGLNDRNSENHFEWTSGAQVTYTNWIKDHSDNFVSHTQEDCVLFVPYKNGEWDDLPCGSNFGFGLFGDSGETHPIVCQYHVGTGSPLIG